MTITDDINSLTGKSFSPIQVTAAITASTNTISGYLEETIIENTNELLDTAITLLARKFLERGRISTKQNTQETPADYVDRVIPLEVLALLDKYRTELAGVVQFSINTSPQDHSPSTPWRT
ncbi:hypothetical protein LCGC14_0547630 [marine sediment metagenome]|uniref:Uncharacterized protein n=1 Tax=marine sediment metagenome TaxID=412755 RepID=A0A0F9UC86_9ZZZZ